MRILIYAIFIILFVLLIINFIRTKDYLPISENKIEKMCEDSINFSKQFPESNSYVIRTKNYVLKCEKIK